MLLRTLSACLVALSLLAVSHQSASSTSATPQYLVVIVMDGFRPDYTTLAPMKHLHALMRQGMWYDNAWVGQMESETPTGHATIATGVYPRKHGVVGFGWRDPSSGVFVYAPTNLKQIAQGDLTRTIEGGGVPTLSDLIHTQNKRDIAVAVSGEKYYAAASMGAGADYVLYGKDDKKQVFRPVAVGPNIPPASTRYTSVTGDSSFGSQDDFVARLAVRLAESLRPRALLVNLPDPDIAGHYYGGMANHRGMAEVVRGTDWAIGRIISEYRKLGIFDKTLFVITADHGMASNSHIVPIHPMYNVVKKSGVAQLDQEYRITVGSVWLRDPNRASGLATLMAAKHFNGVEGALFKTTTASGSGFTAEASTAARLSPALLSAYLDLANTEAGPTGPDVVLPYVENATGLTVPKQKHWGSHGGFSWGVQHIPLLLVGPGVRHGVSHFPAKLVDIAPTIERALGIPIPSGVDGVVLTDALSAGPTSDRTDQEAVHARRSADVNVLRAHSQAQTRGTH